MKDIVITTDLKNNSEEIIFLLNLRNMTDATIVLQTPAVVGVMIKKVNDSFNFSNRIDNKPNGEVEISSKNIFEFEFNLTEYLNLSNETLDRGSYIAVIRCLVRNRIFSSDEISFKVE